jgi:hypothetical protein
MTESQVGSISSQIEKSIVWQGGYDETVQDTVQQALRDDALTSQGVPKGVANNLEYAMPDILNSMQYADPSLASLDYSTVDRMKQGGALDALVGNYLDTAFNAIDTSDDGILDNVELNMWDYGLNRNVQDGRVAVQDNTLEWTAGGHTAVFGWAANGELTSITQSGANANQFVMDQSTGNWTDSRGTQYGPVEIVPYEVSSNGQTTFEPVQFSAQILSGSNAGGWILHKADNSEVVTNEQMQIRSIRYPSGDQRIFFYDKSGQPGAVKFIDANDGTEHTTPLAGSQPQLYRDGTLIVNDGEKSTVYFTNGESRDVDAVPGGDSRPDGTRI